MKFKKDGKNKVNLIFALLAVGSGVALASCTQSAQPDTSTSSIVEPSSKVDSDDTTSDDASINNPSIDDTSIDDTSAEDISEDESSSETSSQDTSIDDKAERFNLTSQIILYYKSELNRRLREEAVSDVELNYFVIKDVYGYGKTLEANGYATFVDENDIEDIRLGISISEDTYQDMKNLDFMSYDEYEKLEDYYSLNQLTYLNDMLQQSQPTFSYSFKSGEEWDLEELSPAQIETALEKKYCDAVNDMFMQKFGSKQVARVDFKYVKVYYDNFLGNVVRIKGSLFALKNNKELSFSVILGVNDDNYSKLQSAFSESIYDETKDLKDNYSKSQINLLDTIANGNSQIREYFVADVPYVVNDLSN